MVMPVLPPALATWREAPRGRVLNGRSLQRNGRYVLCGLQQALRGRDNPVIDAAVRLGNALRLPALVYHGVREEYRHASHRLHRLILGASLDLASVCRERGLAFACHVDGEGQREKGVVYRFGADAPAIAWRISRPSSRGGRPGGSPGARPLRSMR